MSGPLMLSPRSPYGPLSPATGATADSAQASAATGSAAAQTAQSSGGSAPTAGPIAPTGPVASDANAAAWLLAWGVLIVLVVLINRTKVGATITYYVAVLAVLFLVLTQYKFIAATLAPFQQSQAAVTEDSTGGTAGGVQDSAAAAGSSDLTGLNG